MVSEDQRQRAIEMNRSLRLIKNELESLLEKNVISGETFSNIVGQLPTEASISNPTPQLPTAGGLANMSISPAASPPTYTQSQAGRGASAASPGPGRQGSPASRPPPPPLPGRPPLAFAQALYRYDATDERDVGMERGDRIVVLEYMNADWWLGRNDRTGREGIFPQNYVDVYDERVPVPGSNNRAPGPVYNNNNNNPWAASSSEKVQYPGPGAGGVPYAMTPAQGYPMQPPPGQANPYNASVPPMAMAEQQPQQQQPQDGGQQGHSKFAEQGKKFGKKLGNAAIFGAGATLGADLVNSIF